MQRSQELVPPFPLSSVLPSVPPLLSLFPSIAHCMAFEFWETMGKLEKMDYMTTMNPQQENV